MNDPICALCGRQMVIVEIHHKRGVTSRTPLCRSCIRSHVAQQPAADDRPKLTLIRRTA